MQASMWVCVFVYVSCFQPSFSQRTCSGVSEDNFWKSSETFSMKTCGYSLEEPHWDPSNEYQQCMLSWRNKNKGPWATTLTWVKDEISFEHFLLLALAAILFNGVEPLRPSLNSDQQNFSSFWSCCNRAKVWEEMSKIDFQDGGCGGHLGFSIGSFIYFVSTRPNAHHQV